MIKRYGVMKVKDNLINPRVKENLPWIWMVILPSQEIKCDVES
jgi:hypothetical protein